MSAVGWEGSCDVVHVHCFRAVTAGRLVGQDAWARPTTMHEESRSHGIVGNLFEFIGGVDRAEHVGWPGRRGQGACCLEDVPVAASTSVGSTVSPASLRHSS